MHYAKQLDQIIVWKQDFEIHYLLQNIQTIILNKHLALLGQSMMLSFIKDQSECVAHLQ